MSRSRKHVPGYKDNCSSEKEFARQHLRHQCDVPNGGAYKKYWDPWNISDYSFLLFDRISWKRYYDPPFIWREFRKFSPEEMKEYWRPKKMQLSYKDASKYGKLTYKHWMK